MADVIVAVQSQPIQPLGPEADSILHTHETNKNPNL